jgi:hypothetical protein
MVVHCARHGGDSGSYQSHFPYSLDKSGGCIAPPVAVTRRCTTLTTAVNTGHSGDTLTTVASRPRLGGHRPRGGGATGQGGGVLAKYLPLGLSSRSLPQGWQCTRQARRCPHGSTPSPATPPFLHIFHHLCKCANTPSVSPSRASVLAFSQSFFKGYSLFTECALGLKCICKFSNT